jgi:amino acid transporter
VLVTGLGLVLAHHVAFRMSTRLVNEGLLTGESVEAMRAQALGGVPVAMLAALPVFVLGEDPGETVAELLLLALVLAVGYRTARFSSRPIRALAYAALLVVVVAAVVGIKLAVGH